MNEKLILNPDGTFSREITLSENIGRQDHILARLAESPIAGSPVFVGKHGAWHLYVGRALDGCYGFALAENMVLKKAMFQLNGTSGRWTFVPWRAPYPKGAEPGRCALRLCAPLTVWAPARYRFMMQTRLIGTRFEVPRLFLIGERNRKVAPLPNIHNGGTICEGGSSSTSRARDAVNALKEAVDLFENSPGNADLVTAADIRMVEISINTDGDFVGHIKAGGANDAELMDNAFIDRGEEALCDLVSR